MPLTLAAPAHAQFWATRQQAPQQRPQPVAQPRPLPLTAPPPAEVKNRPEDLPPRSGATPSVKLTKENMVRICADQSEANVAQRVEACTMLLQSGIKEKPRAVAYALRGLAYLDRGDVAHAIPDFDSSITLAQDDASVFQNRGNAWYARGNFGRAAADYDEAVRLDPNEPSIYLNRGTLRRDLGNNAEALADFEKALALGAKRTTLFLNRAQLYVNKRDYTNAIADYDQALSLEPGNIEILMRRAAARRAAGQFDAAIADYVEVQKHDDKNIEAIQAQADTQRQKGQFTQAFATYERALAIDPNVASTYRMRAQLHAERGNRKLAIADIQRALKFEWKSEYIKMRAALRLQEGDTRGAFNDAASIFKIEENHPDGLAIRGGAFARSKDYAKAQDDLDAAIAASPNNLIAHYERAQMFNTRGDKDRALADISKAIELGALGPDPWRMRGDIYKARKDYAHAIEDYTQALKRNDDLNILYFERAALRKAAGLTDLALADYDTYLTREPKNRAALLDRAQLRKAKGNTTGAIADYDAVISMTGDNANLYRERVELLLATKAYARAAGDLDRLIKLEPNNMNAYAQRGGLREQLNNKVEALADYKVAAAQNEEARAAFARLSEELRPKPPVKVTTKADAKAEPKTDGKSDAKADVKSEDKPSADAKGTSHLAQATAQAKTNIVAPPPAAQTSAPADIDAPPATIVTDAPASNPAAKSEAKPAIAMPEKREEKREEVKREPAPPAATGSVKTAVPEVRLPPLAIRREAPKQAAPQSVKLQPGKPSVTAMPTASRDLRKPDPRGAPPAMRTTNVPPQQQKQTADYRSYSRTPLPVDTRLPGSKSNSNDRKKADPRRDATSKKQPRFTDAFSNIRR